MDTLLRQAQALLDHPWLGPLSLAVGWILGAYLVELVVCRTLIVLARRTRNELDDKIVESIRRPIFLSVLLIGLAHVIESAEAGETVRFVLGAITQTFAVLIWSMAAFRIGGVVLAAATAKPGDRKMVQARTLPIFNLVIKVSTVTGGLYFMFLAWEIDLTAWLASAGILGIALGFAAQDSLANLFAGIFILADSPYKIGDFIVIDGGLRGRVSQIGIRSTRILTRDDIEITIPNSVMGASKIINEAGGPFVAQRARVAVSAAYGSDVDQVQRVLLDVPKGVPGISSDPEPQVRFRAFGGSGLEFELLVWVSDPAKRGLIVHELNNRVYKAFAAAGIEIPYSKHDVYIKGMVAPASG